MFVLFQCHILPQRIPPNIKRTCRPYSVRVRMSLFLHPLIIILLVYLSCTAIMFILILTTGLAVQIYLYITYQNFLLYIYTFLSVVKKKRKLIRFFVYNLYNKPVSQVIDQSFFLFSLTLYLFLLLKFGVFDEMIMH